MVECWIAKPEDPRSNPSEGNLLAAGFFYHLRNRWIDLVLLPTLCITKTRTSTHCTNMCVGANHKMSFQWKHCHNECVSMIKTPVPTIH